MKILFIVPYVPNLIRVRPFQLIRGLLRRGHRVTLACPISSVEDRMSLQTLEAMGVRSLARDLSLLRSLANCLRAIPTATPLQSVYSWHTGLARDIRRMALETHFDVIHVEHVRSVRYGFWLQNEAGLQCVPIVWDSVDCISNLFAKAESASVSRTIRMIARIERPRTAALECEAVHQFERVLFTAEADRRAVEEGVITRHGVHPKNLRVLTNGVDLEYFSPEEATQRSANTVVMTGKMSYHANVAAARFLLEKVMPLVWRSCPTARVVIAGKEPPASLKSMESDSRVTVTGEVEDVRPYLSGAVVAVAPIVYGAGIQNKILEAMACGTPVITTEAGAAALACHAGCDFIVAAEADGFARQIVRLLTDSELAAEVGRAGRRYVEAHHSWDSVAEQLENIYLEAIAAKQTAASAVGPLVPAA